MSPTNKAFSPSNIRELEALLHMMREMSEYEWQLGNLERYFGMTTIIELFEQFIEDHR